MTEAQNRLPRHQHQRWIRARDARLALAGNGLRPEPVMKSEKARAWDFARSKVEEELKPASASPGNTPRQASTITQRRTRLLSKRQDERRAQRRIRQRRASRACDVRGAVPTGPEDFQDAARPPATSFSKPSPKCRGNQRVTARNPERPTNHSKKYGRDLTRLPSQKSSTRYWSRR